MIIVMGIIVVLLIAAAVLFKPLSLLFVNWRINQDVRSENHTCRIFAKVLDQDNNPVEGVNVELRYFVEEGFYKRTSKNAYTTTNRDGRLYLKFWGRFSGLGFSKPGYWRGAMFEDPSWMEFGASPETKSSKSNPIVFRMWRVENPVANLHRSGDRDFLTPDGTPYGIDLTVQLTERTPDTVRLTRLTPDITPSATVIVSAKNLNREWSKDRDKKYNPVDWVLTVEVPNGGLIQTDEIFPYRPPETGYSPAKWELQVNATDPNWKEVKKRFYIRLDNPTRYGLIQVTAHMQPIRDTVLLTVSGLLNLSGSRNLEPDRPPNW